MSCPPVVLHGRQFVVGPAPFREVEGWVHTSLSPETWLSHCPRLRVTRATARDGACWALLGLAVPTLEDEPEPAAALAACARPGPDLYDTWAGRWALVGPRELHLDATGLLGCYFGRDQDGRCWASSSPALLARILFGEAPPPPDPRRLVWARGVSWFVPPRSRFARLERLLPSQTLDLERGGVAPRRLLPALPAAQTAEEASDRLLRSLVTGVRRLAPAGGPLWLALSAGADSRLLLAAARRADLDLRVFTRVAGRMSLADYLLPPRLASALGYEHVYLEARRPLAGRSALVAEHAAGHVSEGDAEPFVVGVRDSLEGISIGGQGFGVGKKYVHPYAPERFVDALETARALGQGLGEAPESSATAGLHDWLAWVERTPFEHIDWRDRWYLEQRMAGWQSSKEQVYDMGRHERFFPINAARSYALLLSLARRHAPGVAHQVKLIERLEPELLRYPVNPPDHAFGRLRSLYLKSRQDPLYVMRRFSQRPRRLLRELTSSARP